MFPVFSSGQTYESFIGKKDSTKQNLELYHSNDTSYNFTNNDSLKGIPSVLEGVLESVLDQSEKAMENEMSLEIDGLIVDETLTKAGKDFYYNFFRNWEAPANAKNYSITIIEKPFRAMTTQIFIKINDNEVFKSMIQPRNDYIVQLSDYAISRCQQFLANYDEIMKQLEGEDKLGSGIF